MKRKYTEYRKAHFLDTSDHFLILASRLLITVHTKKLYNSQKVVPSLCNTVPLFTFILSIMLIK